MDGTLPRVWPWLRRWRIHLGLIAIGCALTFFGWYSYRAVERDLSQAALAGRSAIATLAASTLTQDFQRLMDVGRSLASRVRFGQLIEAGRWGEAVQIMSSVPRDFPTLQQVLLVDTHGELQAAIPELDGGLAERLREHLRGLPLTSQPFISDVRPAGDAAGRAYFLVVVPVLGSADQPLATLVLLISTQRFVELFAQLELEPLGAIEVVDRRGQLAFDSSHPSSIPVMDLATDADVRRLRAGVAGIESRSASGHVVAFAPTAFGWGVLARWPLQTVFAARDAQLRRVLFVCGLIAVMLAMAFGLVLQLAVERRQRGSERRANLELESRVRERTAQLEKANVDLESFSYSVSHDLRAPLRAIDGYLHLLVEEHQDVFGAHAKRYIDNVQRNVRHMARLIDELLELARVGRIALNQEAVDMGALVSEVLPTVLGPRNHIVVTVAALLPACADATLVRQVWLNLLDNAVKYSSQAVLPQIRVCAEACADEVIYCVSDNGVGFDMQHYGQLFKPFSRLHGPGEFSGTGVGLALVKRIVERHHGRVWAESIPNQSTKVFFSLPRVAT